jgi:hypothetical protein
MPARPDQQLSKSPSDDRSSSSTSIASDPAAPTESSARPPKGKIKLRFVDSSHDWPALAEARLRAFESTALDSRLSPIERRLPFAERVSACQSPRYSLRLAASQGDIRPQAPYVLTC